MVRGLGAASYQHRRNTLTWYGASLRAGWIYLHRHWVFFYLWLVSVSLNMVWRKAKWFIVESNAMPHEWIYSVYVCIYRGSLNTSKETGYSSRLDIFIYTLGILLPLRRTYSLINYWICACALSTCGCVCCVCVCVCLYLSLRIPPTLPLSDSLKILMYIYLYKCAVCVCAASCQHRTNTVMWYRKAKCIMAESNAMPH